MSTSRGGVGPNGCGKSNIVDAIRWAMGEQSAKNLRGKAMDDVIFNGSESRGPHSFAEVTLTFANDDGLAPAEYREYAEIKVTRRLDRSGKSDYRINGAAVRLMDITNLFLGTGVGTKRAYSIIEQGRIGYIVSSSPRTGATSSKRPRASRSSRPRRRPPSARWTQTRQNLLRVGDIITELDKNLASLKRQAQKAERYKSYRAEQRDLELHVASFRYLELFVSVAWWRSELLDRQRRRPRAVRNALRVREAETRGPQRLLAQRRGVRGRSAPSARLRARQRGARSSRPDIKQQRERLEGLRERERLAEREITALR